MVTIKRQKNKQRFGDACILNLEGRKDTFRVTSLKVDGLIYYGVQVKHAILNYQTHTPIRLPVFLDTGQVIPATTTRKFNTHNKQCQSNNQWRQIMTFEKTIPEPPSR